MKMTETITWIAVADQLPPKNADVQCWHARMANEYNCSLYDVQDLLRHANIATTERYVEPSDGVGAMVRGL